MIIERSTSRMEKTITRTIVENSVMMVILFLTKKKKETAGTTVPELWIQNTEGKGTLAL